MQLDAQRFLRLVERAGSLCCWDTEATGLKGDYNSILVVTVKPFEGRPTSFSVETPGKDRQVVKAVKECLDQYDCWVTYYGKGYDVPMVNTRLLRWGLDPLEKRHHVDMYYVLRYNILTGRRSQGHLLSWLETPEEKMGVSAEMWNRVVSNPQRYLPTMRRRCESDAAGLEALYRRTNHLIREITR